MKSDMKKLNVFHNQCLIRGMFWPEVISNEELYKKTSSSTVVDQIRYRHMRWLGHVFRMGHQLIPRVALRWTPIGRSKPGRPKITRRRTIISEFKQLDLTKGEAQHLAHNRHKWSRLILALCPTRDEEA